MYSVYSKLVREHGRVGKKAGRGFYDYPVGGQKSLWPGLADLFPVREGSAEAEVVGQRLLYAMALESFRCYQEGVLRSMKDGDLGSLLGLGFPPYTGGVFSYIRYVGVNAFADTCRQFAQLYGPRFAVPEGFEAAFE
jgi:3-hydroxyacyl-CoA dehydrogenase/enoyl-CoA hydratase/3-hydroxybutyryl-CoA epimerase